MNRQRATVAGATLALALGAGAQLHTNVFPAHAAPSLKQKAVTIGEKNDKYGFAPAKITVKAGTKVVWTNMSDAPHTVTGSGAWKFASSTFTQNKSVSFVFKKVGTYHYYCAIHPYMKATVVVTK